MYPVSDEFLTALRFSHTVVSRCELWRRDELIAADVEVVSGNLVDDSQAVVRRRCDITLPATSAVLSLLPQEAPADGGLWPLGNELRLFSGVRYSDGSDELVPMGVYRIANPNLNDGAQGVSVTLSGYDRARSVSRSRFTEPYVIGAGTNYSEAIKDLVQSRIPWMIDDDFLFMETEYTTPQLVFTSQDDPMEMAIEMARSMGAELFFDGIGRCVLRPEPDPAFTPPVFEYEEGDTSTLTSIQRGLDDERAYNGVIVIGENSQMEAPVRAEAWDTNPNSPTFYDPENPEGSIYGAVPYFISSQYITTEAQAQDAANANLTRVLGVIEKVQFRAINNPAHESGDIITVGRDRIGASGTMILDGLQIGLGGQFGMSGVTRQRRAT